MAMRAFRRRKEVLDEVPEVVKELQEPEKAPTSELGSAGVTRYGSTGVQEYNPELRGRRAIKTYDQMRRSDAQVRSSLRLVKTPITSAQWYMDPATDSQQDKDIANYIQWCLDHMRSPFSQFLAESLLMLDFGYYVFEKVFEVSSWTPPPLDGGVRTRRERPVVKWADFAPRHPSTIDNFLFNSNGTIQSAQHQRIDGESNQMVTVQIPYGKSLVFTLDKEGGDPTGMSVLRSAYKHWYYKENLYKVDAIQKERHGIGIPVVTLPPNFDEDDKRLADEMGRNLRTNEKAHIVLPPNWKIEMLSINTNLVDVLASAREHGRMISANVLGQFLELGQSGSRAVSSDLIGIFFRALRYVTDIIRQELNLRAIPELVKYNWPNVENFPTLRVRRLGDTADWRALSAALRNLKEAGFLTPDPGMEEWVRDQMDLPNASSEAVARTSMDRMASSGKQAPALNPSAQPSGDSAEQKAVQGDKNRSENMDRVPPEGSPTGGR